MAENYTTALQCFKSNCDKLESTPDSEAWNLNHGLYELTKAIQRDLREIQTALNALKR